MSQDVCLRDGQNIYDTPRYGVDPSGLYPGYNGGCERYPTHGVGSAWKETAMWEEKLFHRVLSVMDFTIPENWDRDYTLWVLFRVGFLGIINAFPRIPGRPGYGWIPQYCTFTGYNIYYQPTKIIVANPLIRADEWYIQNVGKHKKNAALIKLTPGFSGAWDLIHYHAEKLAMLSQALSMAILNTRVSKGYIAEGSAMAQAIKTLYDQIDQGKPYSTVTDAQFKVNKKGQLPYFELNGEVGKNYIVDKLQEAITMQLQAFDLDVGIPVMGEKKERRISGEVDLMEKTAMTAIDVWYDTLTRSIEQAKLVIPDLGFSVSRPKFDKGGVVNVEPDPMEP